MKKLLLIIVIFFFGNLSIQAQCTDPDIPTVTSVPGSYCEGDSVTINISGNLNDATGWAIYTGSCGGTLVKTTSGSSTSVTPSFPSTTYYVRGFGGCVTPGSCGTVTVTVDGLPEVPTVTSTPATVCDGDSVTLNISGNLNGATQWAIYTGSCDGTLVNTTSGSSISVTPSFPSTTYYVRGIGGCAIPAGSCGTVTVNVTALDDASFSYGASAYCVDAADPSPTITGLTGGTFSSTAGLSLNAGTGAIDVSVSTPGTYTVTYTTAGTCPNSSGVSVTINALDDASFSYGASAYCVDAADPSPTITGLTGGTFSSTAGLSLNAGTGAIDVSVSTPGTYTVTYTTAGTCPNSSGVSVTINALDDASFSYGASAYCVDAADPSPTITGLTGGTFSSTAGLSLNAGTGAIDVSVSTPGTYTVTYTTAGTCPNSSGVSVTINALDDASFSYGASAYCVDAADPSPTITGLTGGTFSSTAGLSLNAGTGAIDVSVSTPGTYTVTYTTAGTCPNSSGVSVTINALDDASFSYGASAYCVDAADPSPTITGLTGGTFSSTAGLSLNAGTGAIDVSVSTPGTYTVTYTTAGTCPNSSGVSVTINALDDASFSYGASAYCVDAADPSPTITGLTGGTFSSTAGLSLNAGTGAIDVSVSTPGTYTVTYTTAGTCPNSSGVSVTINALDDASFSYGASAYCVDAADPSPTITGLTGGTFSSTAGLSLNAGTGAIDVSVSTPGTYTVTYTTAGTCPNSSGVSVTINALDDASFSYGASAYCVDAADPSPTITGLTGGTFSSTAGLSLNAGTGAIDVSVSTPGTYTVTYTTAGTCPNSSGVSVTINALDDASFSYGASAYCVDAADPSPTITGLTGGTFSSTAGLSLNAGTGAIDVSVSTPGTYTVTYTTAGTCPNSSGVSVTINALDDASFSYGASAYCVDAADPSPTITGLTGGTFSSTAGLSLNAGTGAIDVSVSTPGTYTVTYTTAGTCPNSSGVSVTINALDDASFSYGASAYCVDAADPSPTITGLTGGTFSSTAGLSLNAGTGAIDVSVSTPGTYTVTYTTAGTCPNSSNVAVTINGLPDATITNSDPVLIANTPGAMYQWIDCVTNLPISGETNQSFTATVNGEYAVDVTVNGCTQRSVCVMITTLGINDNLIENFNVFPNPTTGEVNITIPVKKVILFDITGKKVFEVEDSIFSINVLQAGVYFMKITTDKGTGIRKLVKK